MIGRLKLFFDKLYYSGYWRLKKRDGSPEIMTMVFISLCQTNNILTIINLLLLFTNFNNIPLEYLIIVFLLISGLNFYFYEIKERKVEVLANTNLKDDKMLFKSLVYLILSSFFFFFSIYLLNIR